MGIGSRSISKGGFKIKGTVIVDYPLEDEISYKQITKGLDRIVNSEKKNPQTVGLSNSPYKRRIIELLEGVDAVISGVYFESGCNIPFFWKDPAHIKKDGKRTHINTKRLLELASNRHIDRNVDALIETKKTLEYILQ